MMSPLNIRVMQQITGSIIGNLTKPFFGVVLALSAGEENAGVILSLIGFIAIFFGLNGGKVSDIIGRKPVLVISEVVRLLAAVGLVYSFVDKSWNVPLAVISFAVHTFASAYSRPGSEALLLDLCPTDKRKKIFKILHWGWNIAVLIGYIVGGFFFENHAFTLFIALATITLLDILILVYFIDEPKFKKLKIKEAVKEMITAFKAKYVIDSIPVDVLKEDKIFRKYLIGNGFLTIITLGVFAVLPVRLVRLEETGLLDLSPFASLPPLGSYGIIIATYTLTIFVSFILFSKFTNNKKIKNLLIFG